MTKREFFQYCSDSFGTTPDYPFDGDFETAVLRREDNRKWYALVMNISRRKLCEDMDERVDVVNLKIPLELCGAFDVFDGVYPAYHMNKRHWISVILSDVPDELLKHLVGISYEATKTKKVRRNKNDE